MLRNGLKLKNKEFVEIYKLKI